MKDCWDDSKAAQMGGDSLALRVYSSRLLGLEPSLVLHGGGNTSVKMEQANFFGDKEKLIYVKGSGWDLATIEAAGFAPVRLEVLLRLARLKTLSDTDMVHVQKSAMTNPAAPAPSVEAILHALIPFDFVDHTHADAVVAITNTPNGEKTIRELYGDRVLYIPYVMPGFILAQTVYELTRDVNWKKYEGMVLLNHGVFSFSDDAKQSYSRMISLVSQAEDYLQKQKVYAVSKTTDQKPQENLLALAALRKNVSRVLGGAVVAHLDSSIEALSYAALPNLKELASRGPLTPDHILHTKQTPLILEAKDGAAEMALRVDGFSKAYRNYFDRNTNGKLKMLDAAPRWAVWPGQGMLSFGLNYKRAKVVSDISRHTIRAQQWAEGLGGWRALPESNLFEVEYWELEQAKLKKSERAPALQGKIALVTGAAGGIGKACVESLRSQGAAVVALDINPEISKMWLQSEVLGLVCDVTDRARVDACVAQAVRNFGGLDIVVANAGLFPSSCTIDALSDESWSKVMDVNLTSQMYLFRACAPYLVLGIDPSIVVVASKNVPAPGAGAAAYSVSKAGLTQLARVAALELGPKGVRVNMLHPHAVMDTGLWTPELLASRAAHYKMSEEEYKSNNLLKVEVRSKDVAELAVALAGPLFAKTTGAQISVDGGNDRVI